MQIVGDRHYKAATGEDITFSVGQTTQVGTVTVAASSGGGNTLPLRVKGGGHQTLAITAGFTGSGGGSAIIDVVGSQGGSDASRIRQVTSFPFRDAIFTID